MIVLFSGDSFFLRHEFSAKITTLFYQTVIEEAWLLRAL
ncbi:hypothetical protein M6B38_102190 [Iris pallida]|uniref:Uncharacterized protein n=1 Tax=Iris pallida TaxID=29817 RepID=A0AAX6IM05_IRIPA|nr:hypothetical protein M6B38_327210 [Iris pallida]KAJ6854269.1 hypothetical protein M6B38_102190 [Iris pallida]